MITKSDFVDWKASPVTRAVFADLQDKIAVLQEYLGENAGRDTRQDAEFCGAIKAYKDILNIDFSEESLNV
jgi:hypothetical protein